MTAEIVWGVFTRLLALVYVVAFVSLRYEILAWAGVRGVNPLAQKLARMREGLGTWRAVTRHPSLFWISASDAMLRALPLAGAAAAILAACGILSPAMLAIAWVLYLSLDPAFGLSYPWESLLLEAGFLAIFLPPLAPLPAWTMTSAPQPILMLAMHWLLFRLMFGFGKTKFTRQALGDPLYLRSFLISQPMPSPLGWRAIRLPRPLLAGSLALLFVTEIILPFFVFVPGWPRWLAAGGFTGLMIAIQLMGNFGFFNVLVVVLCITLLDPRPATAQHLAALASPGHALAAAAATWSLAAGLCHLPFNSYVARSWPGWPAWGGATGAARIVLDVLRALMPFRTAHAYGVFPPRIGPPLKFIPVFEGTRDGEHWETFEYRFMMSTERSRPRFIAPYAPRLDHIVLYKAFGVSSSNYLGSVFGYGNPYDFSSVAMLDRVVERMMERGSPIRDLFGTVPFGGEPPLRMRIRQYVFAPTTTREQRGSGRYWRRSLVGEHLPERGPDATLYRRWLPAPEQFHPDDRWSRRRAPRLRPLLHAHSLDAVRRFLDADVAALWEPFWSDVIPAADAAVRAGWPAVEALARDLERKHGALGLDALDRVRGAVTTALLERIEPHVLRLVEPRHDVRSYFHAALQANGLTLSGGARVNDALSDVAVLRQAMAATEETRGLMLLTAFRPGTMALHARKYRLAARVLPAAPPPPDVLPGFSLVMPELGEALVDPDERIPTIVQLPDGNWTIDGAPILS